MGDVALHYDVVGGEVLDGGDRRVQLQLREGVGHARNLELDRVDVVGVNVGVGQVVHELAELQTADLGDHGREDGVGSDVEGDAQTEVSRALVHHAGELPIADVKLEEAVAWGKGHLAKGALAQDVGDDVEVLELLVVPDLDVGARDIGGGRRLQLLAREQQLVQRGRAGEGGRRLLLVDHEVVGDEVGGEGWADASYVEAVWDLGEEDVAFVLLVQASEIYLVAQVVIKDLTVDIRTAWKYLICLGW
ncbi:50S ribosomal protein L5 [Babesia caballi]|uniref:50S ribosomal protein L5 n=1 Tax=Babesia caballi TaxID=5871 RepID=A0AAV4LZF5_BABCB|nr:50S ribosomal protein L5 [Babesia caballi]